MKKRNLIMTLLLMVLLVLTAGLFSACNDPKMISMRVVGERKVYIDEFDMDDYLIRMVYDNDTMEEVTLTESNLSQEDLAKLQTVGKHTLTVTYKKATCEWTITLINHNFADLAFEDLTVDYNGQPHTLAVTGLPQGASVEYNINNTQTNAGEYEITATVSMANYNDATLTATLKINTIDFTGLEFDDLTVDYDGEPHTIAVTGLPQGASVEYDKDNTYTNAGEYTVTATVSMANYNDATLTATLKINTIDFTGLVFDDITVDYDGQPHTLAVTGLPQGANVEYDKDNTYTNAGEYTVTATVSMANYNDATLTATLKINKIYFKTLSFIGYSVTYDGIPHSLQVTGAPQDASVDYDKVVTYVNAGEYTVTATISKANYNTATLTATLKINKADFAGLSFDDITVDYDGQPHTLAVTCLPQGANVEYDKEATYTNAGEYTVTATVSMANYNTKTLTATLKINTIDFTGLAFDDITVDYDGEPHTLAVTGVPQGANVEYDKDNTYTNAGEYIVTATVSMPNYNTKTLTATLKINTIDFVGLEFEDLTVDYDGQPHTIAVTGVPQGASVEYDKANTYTDAGEYTITATVSMENYNTTTLTATLALKTLLNIVSGDGYAVVLYSDSHKIQLFGEIVIPEYYSGMPVTTIGEKAFNGCSAITSIKLPSTITTIEKAAFGGCTALTKIDLNLGLTTIQESAFWGCTSLMSLELPSTLTVIGFGFIGNCTNLKELVLPLSLSTIHEGVFFSCMMTRIELPDSVTTIERSAFSGCKNLASIKLSENLTVIGESAFNGCSSLTTIEIPLKMTQIDKKAFYGCSGLIEIVIHSNINKICESAFENCQNLKTVTFSKGLEIIEKRAFAGCRNLTELTVPEGVTTIGPEGFVNCSGLEKVILPESLELMDPLTFFNCSKLKSIKVPNKVRHLNGWNFKGCTNLMEVELSENLLTIGAETFGGCSNLTSINIPASVTKIVYTAFTGCYNLSNICFEGTVEQWNAIEKIGDWDYSVPATEVICSDGTVKIQ